MEDQKHASASLIAFPIFQEPVWFQVVGYQF